MIGILPGCNKIEPVILSCHTTLLNAQNALTSLIKPYATSPIQIPPTKTVTGKRIVWEKEKEDKAVSAKLKSKEDFKLGNFKRVNDYRDGARDKFSMIFYYFPFLAPKEIQHLQKGSLIHCWDCGETEFVLLSPCEKTNTPIVDAVRAIERYVY